MRKRRKVAQLSVLSDAAKPENWTRVVIGRFWKALQETERFRKFALIVSAQPYSRRTQIHTACMRARAILVFI